MKSYLIQQKLEGHCSKLLWLIYTRNELVFTRDLRVFYLHYRIYIVSGKMMIGDHPK